MGVTSVPTTGLADWFRYGGERQQKRRRSSSERDRNAISNAKMSIRCSPYAMLSAMTEGLRCGKRHWVTIESCEHSKGRLKLSNGYSLSRRLVMPPLRNPSLLLNLYRRRGHLLY